MLLLVENDLWPLATVSKRPKISSYEHRRYLCEYHLIAKYIWIYSFPQTDHQTQVAYLFWIQVLENVRWRFDPEPKCKKATFTWQSHIKIYHLTRYCENNKSWTNARTDICWSIRIIRTQKTILYHITLLRLPEPLHALRIPWCNTQVKKGRQTPHHTNQWGARLLSNIYIYIQNWAITLPVEPLDTVEWVE